MKADLIHVKTKDQIILHVDYYEADIQKPAVIMMPGAATTLVLLQTGTEALCSD